MQGMLSNGSPVAEYHGTITEEEIDDGPPGADSNTFQQHPAIQPHESSPFYLDTIAEEEEDMYSSVFSLEVCDHHQSDSESGLFEARYFHSADLHEWYHHTQPIHQEVAPLGAVNNRTASPGVDVFPVCYDSDGDAIYGEWPPEISRQEDKMSCGSKSLPTVLPRPQNRSPLLQRSLSFTNTCINNICKEAHASEVPSPTSTQVRNIAEWPLTCTSSPGITSATEVNFIGASWSINTEDLDLSPPKMKRSPAVEGVSYLLKQSGAEFVPLLRPPPTPGKEPAEAVSLSTTERISSTSSSSPSCSETSLCRRYAEGPPVNPRPNYDYGTDEYLLEMFMTPAAAEMHADDKYEERDAALAVGSKWDYDKKSLLKDLMTSQPCDGLVWKDNCRTDEHDDPDDDLPYIDHEESYSEDWYVTTGQWFPWIERAQLADLDEITLYSGKRAILFYGSGITWQSLGDSYQTCLPSHDVTHLRGCRCLGL